MEALDYEGTELREPELEAAQSLLTGAFACSKGIVTRCCKQKKIIIIIQTEMMYTKVQKVDLL